MPVHDWTRVTVGAFHHFHQRWIGAIGDALDTRGLPPGYCALAEPQSRGGKLRSGMMLSDLLVNTRFHRESDATNYARRADRLTVRHLNEKVIAVIEIISPGNKDSRHAIRAFTRKAVAFLDAGVHLLIIDLFPPNPRTPQGMHKAIWDRIHDEPYEAPQDKPLTLAAYVAGTKTVAYVEPVGVGDTLPDMPIFLAADRYVPCPLEATYQTTWNVFPAPLKWLLESPSPTS